MSNKARKLRLLHFYLTSDDDDSYFSEIYSLCNDPCAIIIFTMYTLFNGIFQANKNFQHLHATGVKRDFPFSRFPRRAASAQVIAILSLLISSCSFHLLPHLHSQLFCGYLYIFCILHFSFASCFIILSFRLRLRFTWNKFNPDLQNTCILS